jgi:hypothetical protein
VYDRATGEQLWAVAPEATLAGLASSVVLVTRGREVIALDADDGAFRWRAPFAHPHGVEVRAASGRLFLSTSSGMGDPPASEADAASAPMSGTTDVATATLATGETLRFAETAEGPGRRSMCVFVDGATAPAMCLPEVDQAVPPDEVVTTGGARLFLSSGIRNVHVVSLPPGLQRPVSVRDAKGGVWPSAEATGTDILYIVEPTPYAAGSGSVHEVVDVVAADGSIVGRIWPPGTEPSTPPPNSFLALGACYRANGADYHAEPAGAAADSPPTTRLPAGVTAAAWEACREVYAAAAGGSGDDALSAYHACMAGQGWLPPLWFQHREQWAAASGDCGRPVTG